MIRTGNEFIDILIPVILIIATVGSMVYEIVKSENEIRKGSGKDESKK
jgi:hypothetical protein